MSTALLGLFKAIQESERKKGTTKDTLAEMFQKGLRPRAGGTGMGASPGGIGGFLQEAFGGGQEIDYSQFEGPPQLVGGPEGSVYGIGDQGRGAATEVVAGKQPKRFSDPEIENGQIVQIDPETGKRTVLGQAPANADSFARFFEIGGKVHGIRQDGSTQVILDAPEAEPEMEGGDIEVGEGNEMGLDPGFYRKKGTGFVRTRGPTPAPPRGAGDVQAAMRAMMDVQAALDDEDLIGEMDDAQLRQLEGLRNELILAYPQLAREGLKIPRDAGAAGAAGRIDAMGGTPTETGPGVGATVIRTLGDIVKDIKKTLKSLPPSTSVGSMGGVGRTVRK